MKVEVMDKSPVEKTVSIEVEPDGYKDALENILKKVRNEVQIPGFRKGKAPKAMILRKVGMDALKKDLLDELIPKLSPKVIEDNKLVPLSTPVCENFDEIVFEEGKPINFQLTFEVKPEFEMVQYKGLELQKITYDIDEEDLLEKQIDTMLEQAATMVPIDEERGLKEGDVAHVDFESFKKDGTPLKSGSASDYYMTVEKQNFIPGFVENLIGKKAGEKWEFDAKFPDSYPDEVLAGQDVKFKLDLHGIMKKEIPQKNDDFAKSTGRFQTFQELEDDTKNRIHEHVEQQYRYQLQDQIMKRLVAGMKELPVPVSLVRGHQERYIRNLIEMLQRQNKTLEDHLKGMNMSPNTFLKMIEPQATDAAKGELILDKIAEMEKVEVTLDEIDAEVKKVAANLAQEFDVVKKAMERDNYLPVVKYEIRNRKIFDLIIESSNVTEKEWKQVQEEMKAQQEDMARKAEEAKKELSLEPEKEEAEETSAVAELAATSKSDQEG